jgi:hypothetical protein
MTTEISHVGWRVLRVLYQGRIYGEESAATFSFRKLGDLLVDPEVSFEKDGLRRR